jgi:hypothetical protein
MDEELSELAILANIEYYRNLYHKHIALAREYNKELWRWNYKLTKRTNENDMP